jgi:hypothetical protein
VALQEVGVVVVVVVVVGYNNYDYRLEVKGKMLVESPAVI